jgi:hypothetical protein
LSPDRKLQIQHNSTNRQDIEIEFTGEERTKLDLYLELPKYGNTGVPLELLPQFPLFSQHMRAYLSLLDFGITSAQHSQQGVSGSIMGMNLFLVQSAVVASRASQFLWARMAMEPV